MNNIELFQANLTVLKKQAPDNAEVLALRAAEAALEGDQAGAADFAALAFAGNPTSENMATLAGYKIAAGDRPGALELLENWLNGHPDDQQIRLFAGIQFLTSGREEDAIQQFELLLETEPDQVVALNNLAWLIRESQPQKALQYAQRANELAPNSAEILDTLAVIQYTGKDYEQAASSIREALLRSPDNPSIRYHDAMIAAALGKKDKAVSTLENVLAEGGDFPERQEAQALLAELK